LIASNEQFIECEIRTLLELEKAPKHYDTVHVFYRCLERKDEMGCQIADIEQVRIEKKLYTLP
jgi:hypothetical protein